MTRSVPTREYANLSRVKTRRILLLLLIAFLTCYRAIATGQAPRNESQPSSTELDEVEVPIIQNVDSHRFGFGYCGSYARAVGPIVTEEEFRQLIAAGSVSVASSNRDRCSFLNRLKVDFDKHTLLTYGVNGDCFVRATAQLYRNDSSRKYVQRITKIYGGCRAAGSFEGWLVVEKLRPDYKIEVELFARDESGETRRLDKR